LKTEIEVRTAAERKVRSSAWPHGKSSIKIRKTLEEHQGFEATFRLIGNGVFPVIFLLTG
jgi:hypothetical protein